MCTRILQTMWYSKLSSVFLFVSNFTLGVCVGISDRWVYIHIVRIFFLLNGYQSCRNCKVTAKSTCYCCFVILFNLNVRTRADICVACQWASRRVTSVARGIHPQTRRRSTIPCGLLLHISAPVNLDKNTASETFLANSLSSGRVFTTETFIFSTPLG